ncbi:MAG: glycosyltransferase [Aulosira sp. DedQUE10]|nr:glycosyltransferase [Aulosira sp. DedQUE10]
MTKKKVVFIIRDLEYGGAQRQLVTLVKDFDKQKFDVTVLHFYSGAPLAKDLKERDISVISLEKRGRWDVLGFLWRLIRHLKQIEPDLVHTYMGEANVIAMLLKPFFPSTPMIWGVRISQTPADAFDWLGNILGKLESLLSHAVDLIIVNSHSGRKDYLSHGFPAEKMVVISNGIDTERFQPDKEAGVKVRAEWGISETQILIGLVGRIYPQKDHSNFLRAAALLCKEYQDLRFVCVGTSPHKNYIQELYQLAEELGISKRVIWAGARGDMRAVHNALDIAVSASAFGEGFGNVIGEAMACGVPCVVTDVGDSAWIVGNAGIVVPPQNPEALAAGCRSLIVLSLSEKIAFKDKARRKILECFSVNNLVETTQLYCLTTLGI